MGSFELSGNRQSNKSRPLTPAELDSYFQLLNTNSGGRLNTFATTGTAPTAFNPLTAEELRTLGGAGATRQASAQTNLNKQLEQIGADASLTLAQRQRASQNANTNYRALADAIAKETEAALTQLAAQNRAQQYEAGRANAALPAQDLALLAQILYGGKGDVAKGSGYGFTVKGSYGQ